MVPALPDRNPAVLQIPWQDLTLHNLHGSQMNDPHKFLICFQFSLKIHCFGASYVNGLDAWISTLETCSYTFGIGRCTRTFALSSNSFLAFIKLNVYEYSSTIPSCNVYFRSAASASDYFPFYPLDSLQLHASS